jgi:hypothetical protein
MSFACARAALAVGALVAVAAACGGGSKAPQIVSPLKIDSYCKGETVPRATAIGSAMTSTDDKILPGHPDQAGIIAEVRATSGAVAHWHDQLLALPNVSKLLGETDGYARVEAVAVPLAKPSDEHHVIYMQLLDRGIPAWFAMTAYDVQDVCVTGRPQP